jgi:pimeloyl-ACP methyl ester carboxylesterase
MADWPKDVAALADALGIDRFVVAGHSTGGPYAVACSALLPGRVLAGATEARRCGDFRADASAGTCPKSSQ